MSVNGMIRPCSRPTSKRGLRGAPKARSHAMAEALANAIAFVGIDIGESRIAARTRTRRRRLRVVRLRSHARADRDDGLAFTRVLWTVSSQPYCRPASCVTEQNQRRLALWPPANAETGRGHTTGNVRRASPGGLQPMPPIGSGAVPRFFSPWRFRNLPSRHRASIQTRPQ
jgi:hypothetical protein